MDSHNLISLRCSIHIRATAFARHCGKSKKTADLDAMRDYCRWLHDFESAFDFWVAGENNVADVFASIPEVLHPTALPPYCAELGHPVKVPAAVAHCVAMAVQMYMLDKGEST